MFAVLFITTVVLSSGLGAPKTENEAVFAKRDVYQFTRGGEVSRARFVTVGVCFILAWHLLAMGFAAEQWAPFRATDPGPIKPHPPKRKKKTDGLGKDSM